MKAASEYLNQRIDCGGEKMTVAEFIRQMRAEGHAERCIQAYIVGALRRLATT